MVQAHLREKKSLIMLKDGREIRSVLAVPMNLKGKTRGALGIYLIYPHYYEEKEINLLTSFAYQAASAIDNVYFFNELSRHDRMINALYDIDRVISKSLDLDEILKSALAKAMEVTETEAGWIHLLEEDGNTLNMKAHIGISADLVEFFSKIKMDQVPTEKSGKPVTNYMRFLTEEILMMAVKLGKPATLDNTQYPISGIVSPLIKDEIVSGASVPLMTKDKIFGVLTLASRRQRRYSRDDLDLLASIGSQIGVAIENSRLFSELEMHDKRLEALYAIESVVSRSLNLEEIFKVALSKALEVTDTEAGTLYSLEKDVLHLEAFTGFSTEFKEKALTREIGEGIPGIAAQLKKPITMDISQFPSPILRPYVEKEGLVSFIGTPLMSKGEVVGALALGTKKRRTFTQDDLDLLFSIGNVIGIAVENAGLYRESKENLRKLQKAYEELQTLDRMKDEFLSNVSHELKTPLISIKGYGELMYDEKLGSLSNEQKKSLEAIVRNADRLTRLINSILLISSLQAGKIAVQFESVDIGEVVKISIGDFKNTIEKKQILCEMNLPEISRVRGEKDKFFEVIHNLLDNATKFTQIGGKISIRAWDEDENVHLVVADNGIGIPKDLIPKLFSRFYQVDASASRKYGGTGLGLYITKTIVDAFGGKIWIESEIAKGTTVHLLLPIAR